MKSRENFFKHNIIALTILITIVTWFYWNILSTLIRYLIVNDDYSYGLLIPLISGYIIYKKWPQLRKISWQPSWWGLLIIIIGLCLYIIGEIAADLFIPRVSFIITLGGILILLGGRRLTRTLIFPLLILLLMIPLPQLIANKLTLPLQLISSQLATGLLQFIGIPVFRQGNIIDMGVRQMQIVDACSGLRYILALLALGVVFCYFYQRKPWKITVLLLVLVPATILANALRVAGMGVYPILLVGFWHAFSGWLIFIFCFGILAGVNYFLNRLSPPEDDELSANDLKPAAVIAAPENKAVLWRYVLSALLILLLFIPITRRASYAPNYPLKDGFENFPLTIDSWKGRHVHIDPEMVAVTQSQAHLNAEYSNQGKGSVSLWIVYYETQKKAGGFVHSPKGCFVASGWEIEQAKTIDIAEGKPVNWMVVNRMGEKLLIYYWFLQRGRWIADETKNKFFMAYDGFLRRRTDGAMIRLITPVGGNMEAAQNRLTSFAKELAPQLNKFIPD
jgi:exosortase D (VPLPA-CTERM-specific)